MQPDDSSKYRPISLSPEELQSQIRSSWKEIDYDEIRSQLKEAEKIHDLAALRLKIQYEAR